MRLSLLLAIVLVISLLFTTPCTAQRAQEHRTPEEDRPASESHSYMELFSKLERDWTQAIQKKDRTALEAILAPEFTLRTSEDPENPTPRTDWIEKALTSYNIHSSSERAIVIRAFLGVAVVSFVQSQQVTTDGKDDSGDYLVVDLWKASHDKWQVAARYMAPVGSYRSEHRSKAQE
ncbi:MAG: nuclear transport factor 2 family protein [Candidatus Sulfotelmatobacter sp.]